MSLFESRPSRLTQLQLLGIEQRNQLLNQYLNLIQQPEYREAILSEISLALQSNQCEIHVSLPVANQPSEATSQFCYFDCASPIHLTFENGQPYTLQLMFMRIHEATVDYDLMIVDC